MKNFLFFTQSNIFTANLKDHIRMNGADKGFSAYEVRRRAAVISAAHPAFSGLSDTGFSTVAGVRGNSTLCINLTNIINTKKQ